MDEEKLAVAKKLIKALRDTDFPVSDAAWIRLENGSWRLALESSYTTLHGPLKSYKLIQNVIKKHNIKLPLSTVTVVGIGGHVFDIAEVVPVD